MGGRPLALALARLRRRPVVYLLVMAPAIAVVEEEGRGEERAVT